MNSSPLGEASGKTGQPSSEEASLPVLYKHCKDTYDAMLRSSSKQEYRDDNNKMQEAVVYEGFLTKLVTEDLHLSVPYYTTVMGALKKMGCVRQVRRGGSTSPSQWQLYHEPTENLFRTKQQQGKKTSRSAHGSRLDQVEGTVQILNQRVSAIERVLQQFIDDEQGEKV